MSEFHVVVVEIGKVGKVPNSDNLEITQVLDAYPVIFRTGQFKQGDRAVFVPVDALVPLSEPRWEFLKTEGIKTHARIKAKKLRGVFSMGVLTEADPSWEVGQNVQAKLNIEKWEPDIDITTSGECEKDPGVQPYTDIEGLRKYRKYLTEGEQIVCLEKVHGAQGRWSYVVKSDVEGRLFCASHHEVKREDPNNLWWKAALAHDLANKLAKHPNQTFFGEVYGQVQKGFDYGISKGNVSIAFFDIYDPEAGKYLDYPDFKQTLQELDLPMVPVLYEGPWNESLMESLSNGKTSFSANHTREGFVVKPVKERWEHCGRIIFKMVGSDYLLGRGKQKE